MKIHTLNTNKFRRFLTIQTYELQNVLLCFSTKYDTRKCMLAAVKCVPYYYHYRNPHSLKRITMMIIVTSYLLHKNILRKSWISCCCCSCWWVWPPMILLYIPKVVLEYEALAEWWWQGKLNNSREKPVQCHSLCYKSHMDWPWCEPRPPWWEASNYLLPEKWQRPRYHVNHLRYPNICL
jgi:hypothetical protein